jgi:hypothetical protein
MGTTNPLADNAPGDPEDYALVMRARSGDREALEELVRRHQGCVDLQDRGPHALPPGSLRFSSRLQQGVSAYSWSKLMRCQR